MSLPFPSESHYDTSKHFRGKSRQKHPKLMLSRLTESAGLTKNEYWILWDIKCVRNSPVISLDTCHSGSCTMRACVFSCCGLMRHCRVLWPYKQKSPSRENARLAQTPPHPDPRTTKKFVLTRNRHRFEPWPSGLAAFFTRPAWSGAQTLTFFLYFPTN